MHRCRRHASVGRPDPMADPMANPKANPKANVVTFYKFVHVAQPEQLQGELLEVARDLELNGTILIAHEGINGTLTGTHRALEAFTQGLHARKQFSDIVCKYSTATVGNPVFYRLKVRVKPEIVSFGAPGVDPATCTGEHVNAERWNELLEDPEVVVVDTRNSYEIGIGSFPGALDPGTTTFREFPQFVRDHLDPERNRKVAMYCTGGIRCEKASALLLAEGFSEVYQLDGGILKYLETVQSDSNHWQGECFVFDQRVSVDDNLAEGSYQQCFACRRPLSEDDLTSADYREGVRCPHCVAELSDAREAAFSERNRQVALAADRGEQHIGAQNQPAPLAHAEGKPPPTG
jgi:UPF0176 protein